jgi:3-oxoacyl-[acyl-carrier protein] reductase
MVTAHTGQRTALVTGAANGIGRAALAALRADGLRAVGLDLSAIAGDPDFVVADVTSEASVQDGVGRAVAILKYVDVVVNAAGILREGPFATFSLAEFDRLYAVNVRGTFLVSQKILPHIRPGGRIINVASELAFAGRQTAVAYTATKGAVVSLTRSMARELGPDILVNAVAPGPTDTGMLDFRSMSAEQQALENNNPLGRIGKPEEIAAVIAFLASPQATFITGQCYSVDGGAAMH